MNAIDNVAQLLAAEPNVAPAFVQRVQQYVARCGNRRTFLSSSDAAAYERGWSHWPEPLPDDVELSTPMSCGWWDAERAHDERLEDRARQREEERADGWGF